VPFSSGFCHFLKNLGVTQKAMKTRNSNEKEVRKKVQRVAPSHPLVSLIPRKFKKKGKLYSYWAARWRDPDTGKLVEFKLDPTVFPSRESRKQWAIRRSRALAKRRADIESGAPLIDRTPLGDAVDAYLNACGSRLRNRTTDLYRMSADKLLHWADEVGVKTLAELTPAKLTAFRESRISQRKQAAAKGGRRGSRSGSSRNRAPGAVNVELRSIKTMLLQWRSEEKLPNADREAICRCLKSLPLSHEAPAFLTPASCRKLLEAAIRHDNETFAETRLEHLGLRPLGTTPRYEPIGPFVLFLLLTGCRVGEAESLVWTDVDLEALDADGRQVGEITLRAAATKTKRYRTIGLEVCPSIRSLLAGLKLKSGGQGYVFGGKAPVTHTRIESARKRLFHEYGAPRFSWQNLRQSCGTYLTNSPGVYGAASVFMSARQLGHSVAVAEKHYLGVIRGIPREAKTLEPAMGIGDLAHKVIDSVSKPTVDHAQAKKQ
jgi:integrase